MIEIRRADPRDFIEFLHASDAYAASLYPAESNHMLDVEALLRPEMNFFGVYSGAQAAGCGGFWTHDTYAEIKRVWIDLQWRGQGLSRLLMERIEAEAMQLGHTILRLETGVAQAEALSLYRTLGFIERDNFGSYKPDVLSVFMEKQLAKRTTALPP